MKINTAEFVTSNTDPNKCPKPDKPEYAFIGRSNVGKSSLINMLTRRSKLAKTSQTPGKTQLINHFLINGTWYLVDLPGYGFAKISQKQRENWEAMIRGYLRHRENLVNTFVLIDSRHEPQKADMEFMEWLGKEGIPFAMLFTKADKQTRSKTQALINSYMRVMSAKWASLPPAFVTSSEEGTGRDEVLAYLDDLNLGFYEAMDHAAAAIAPFPLGKK